MFITAVKTALVEALVSGFNTINTQYNPNLTGQFNYPSDTSIDLTPNSVTIEYPLEEVLWPAIYVQFRPTKTQWMGLNPDEYITISGNTNAVYADRQTYFEGVIDFQILAMHSEERDRLWDSVNNLVLQNTYSPASSAFYSSLGNNGLVGITLNQGTLSNLGDTVNPGTPWSPEELTYESTIRVQCVGNAYNTKFTQTQTALKSVNISGSLVIQFP